MGHTMSNKADFFLLQALAFQEYPWSIIRYFGEEVNPTVVSRVKLHLIVCLLQVSRKQNSLC